MKLKDIDNPHEFIDKLKKEKYRQIGYGSFSKVFAKSNKSRYVYKVNLIPDNSIDYLNWVKRSKNKYGPKIHFLKEFDDGTYVVKMERVYKCTQKEYRMVAEASFDSPKRPYWWNQTFYKRDVIEKRFPGIFDFFKKYNKKFNDIDMHSGNIGKRRNNQLVIFDPYVGDW